MKSVFMTLLLCLSVLVAARETNKCNNTNWDEIKLKIKVRGKSLVDEGKCTFCTSRFKKYTDYFYTAYKYENFIVFTSKDENNKTKYLMPLKDKFYNSVLQTFPECLNDARVFYIEKGGIV